MRTIVKFFRRALQITGLIVIATAALAEQPDGTKPILEKATFAGGCFWCEETAFLGRPGVASVTSGYTGGTLKNPSYEEVSEGGTGHAEAVQVVFDPARISYVQLLEIFWKNTDPTVANQQFCDHGEQYRSEIFTHTPEQSAAALASKLKWQNDKRFAGKTIYTLVTPASEFYPAEEYHQKYAEKNPTRYKFYRWNCGRDQRLDEIWGADRDASH